MLNDLTRFIARHKVSICFSTVLLVVLNTAYIQSYDYKKNQSHVGFPGEIIFLTYSDLLTWHTIFFVERERYSHRRPDVCRHYDLDDCVYSYRGQYNTTLYTFRSFSYKQDDLYYTTYDIIDLTWKGWVFMVVQSIILSAFLVTFALLILKGFFYIPQRFYNLGLVNGYRSLSTSYKALVWFVLFLTFILFPWWLLVMGSIGF